MMKMNEKVHEGGCLVATGCEGGNVALIELAEGLASAHRNDKTSVTAVSSFETLSEAIFLVLLGTSSFTARHEVFSCCPINPVPR